MADDAFGSLDLFSAFKNDKNEKKKKQTYRDVIENGDEERAIPMSAELALLRAENMKLKSRLRLYERFGHLFPSQTPLAEIDYFKSPLSIECQTRIESELFTVLSENRDTAEEHGAGDDCGPYGQVLYLPYYILDSVGKFWDTTPVQYGDNTPLFTSMFKVALDDRVDKLDMFGSKLPKENISNGPECFNCGGPHRISDCKEPKDQKKIKENLKLFKESRGGPNHNDRYHVRVVKEIEDKFKEFVPGKVSDSLKLALGMENHELPPHIYRMRTFGYPPAYSLDPPVANSDGLQMYYKPGGGAREDGELEETPLPCVIQYPGYTAPLPTDVIDKFRTRNLPYNTVTPTLSDKRKPKVDPLNKRRRLSQPLGEDDMEVDDVPDVKVEPAYARPIIKQPPMPIGPPPPATPTPPPPPRRPVQPLPPGTEDIVDITEEMTGEKKKTASATGDSADTSSKQPSQEEVKEEGEVPEECPAVLNRSVVSETNKIGVKFDQVEDYGPLDERAGNFTKLQCILRSKKRSMSRTPTRTPTTRTPTSTPARTPTTSTPTTNTPSRMSTRKIIRNKK